MVLEFKITNMFSIYEEVSLDLQAVNAVSKKNRFLIDNTFQCGNERMLKSIAIYGANASGKSSLINAIRSSITMILRSHEYNEDTTFPFTPFKFDKDNTPSKFYIRFLLDRVEYEYSFSAINNRILTEELYYYPNNRRSIIFIRDERKGPDKKNIYRFRGAFARPMDVATNTSDKTLFISRASQMDRGLLRNIYSFFNDEIVLDYNIPYGQIPATLTSEFKESLLAILRTADSDIINFVNTPQGIITQHKNDPSVNFELNKEESGGTIKLFKIAITLIDVIRSNKLMIVDELETSLHPLLVEYIVNAFNESDAAQIIFTTHNTLFLMSGAMRSDQIYFTLKRADGSTELYSLCDFKGIAPKPGVDIDYLQGRFDAIPYIANITID